MRGNGLTRVMLTLLVLMLIAGCDGSGGTLAAQPGSPPPAGSTSRTPIAAGMVTDTGGIGDLSFNMMGWKGLQRAEQELGTEPSKVESRQESDYAGNLERLAQKGCKVVFAVGFALASAVNEVAPRYPDTQFVIIDSDEGKAPNVSGITFREEEGAFLVGALAGGMTQSGKLGFVGGMEIPLIKRFEAGYRAGASTVRPDVRVQAKYTNNWREVDKGRELALSLFGDGADVVFHASGSCGLGVIEAARQKGPGFWAIGVDADQDFLGTADPKNPAPPSRVLTSMMKRVDNAVFTVCKELSEGSFKPGLRAFGVKEAGVGLTPLTYTKEQIPNALRERVDRLSTQIAEGKLKPPRTLAEPRTWKAPTQPTG